MSITDAQGNVLSSAKTVQGVKPVGSQVIVELLTPQEIMGSKLLIEKATNLGAPQGYIIGIGPMLDVEKYGFKIGDRVVLQGSFVPLPEVLAKNGRAVAAVEPYVIKAILLE